MTLETNERRRHDGVCLLSVLARTEFNHPPASSLPFLSRRREQKNIVAGFLSRLAKRFCLMARATLSRARVRVAADASAADLRGDAEGQISRMQADGGDFNSGTYHFVPCHFPRKLARGVMGRDSFVKVRPLAHVPMLQPFPLEFADSWILTRIDSTRSFRSYILCLSW